MAGRTHLSYTAEDLLGRDRKKKRPFHERIYGRKNPARSIDASVKHRIATSTVRFSPHWHKQCTRLTYRLHLAQPAIDDGHLR